MLLLKISIKCIIFAYNSTNNWVIVCADISTCDTNALMKRLWCWEGLGARGEGDDRGWDGSMASLTWWTWVWVNSRSWWWTGRPGVLRFMGSQRVGHDWATDLIWSELIEHKLWNTLYNVTIQNTFHWLIQIFLHSSLILPCAPKRLNFIGCRKVLLASDSCWICPIRGSLVSL